MAATAPRGRSLPWWTRLLLHMGGPLAIEAAVLREENARLRDALAFYSAEEHYREVGVQIGAGEWEGRCDIWDDAGEIARQALAEDVEE